MTGARVRLRMRVNGSPVEVLVAPTSRLLDVIRDELGLTGTKEGCGEGECGACTVIVDGMATDSCLMLALDAQDRAVLTIEGLRTDTLHVIQQAFIDEGGTQCGFCTPGFIMSAYALLASNPSPSDTEIGEALEGNLCRCTGYLAILRSVRRASRLLRGERS